MIRKKFSAYFVVILVCMGAIKIGEAKGKMPSSVIYSPFGFHVDPMVRLLLVNIENDPDSLYLGFEPQVFNDSINGQGMLVIAWRIDGYVDVYHQPGLRPDAEKYDIAGKGLANMQQRELDSAFFYITQQGAQAWLQWEDIAGRLIEIRVEETNSRSRKPFGLLAPMGHAAQNPSALPLVLLHEFYFVRQKDSEISVLINGRAYQPDKLSLPIDRQRMYFARYCSDPLIATLNPAMDGMLSPLQQQDPFRAVGHNNYFELVHIQGKYHLKSMYTYSGDHELRMDFEPAFPNIAQWNDTVPVSGQFTIQAGHSTGAIKGHYSLIYEDGEFLVRMSPCEGWKPRPDKLSLRFLFTVAKVFRQWPASYVWQARIRVEEHGAMMKSQWERL